MGLQAFFGLVKNSQSSFITPLKSHFEIDSNYWEPEDWLNSQKSRAVDESFSNLGMELPKNCKFKLSAPALVERGPEYVPRRKALGFQPYVSSEDESIVLYKAA